MTPEQFDRVREAFSVVLSLPVAERGVYLDRLREADALVAQEVASLLTNHPDSQALFDTRVTPGAGALEVQAPERIGRYRVLRQIGVGGMGSVYLAEQSDPHRKVAIKLIKLGMDTRDVIARFEAERQALALMEHPNIAKVFDAGATETGRPYFVMELVEGAPLTHYCRERDLPLAKRLELLAAVCDAIQHAHQKGVVHRDLKPSNVLVSERDGHPTPMVIDFGIAKATGDRLTGSTVITQQGQFVGTPAYMSPEQAGLGGQDVDTRSDIYSLGAMLYELITGATPFDPASLLSKGLVEMQRIIRSVDPQRPSAKATTPQLARQLRGDLDWIVMRCLEKDRARRYESASALATDLRRYLADQPVSARPPTLRYRATKFARRNTGLVVGVASAFLLLIAGVTGTSLGLRRALIAREAEQQAAQVAKASEQEALRQARRAQTISEFLIKDMIGAPAPWESGRDVKVADVLDKTAGQLDALRSEPDLLAAVRLALARIYQRLGLYAEAAPLARAAYEEWFLPHGGDERETLLAAMTLGNALTGLDRFDDAERLIQPTYVRLREMFGDQHPETLEALSALATCAQRRGDLERAIELMSQVVAGRTASAGPTAIETVRAKTKRASILLLAGRIRDAESAFLEVLEDYEQAHKPDDSDVIAAINGLAGVYSEQGLPAKAEALSRRSYEASLRGWGPDHPQTAVAATELAMALQRQGKLDEAEPLLRQSLDVCTARYGPDHQFTMVAAHQFANLLVQLGRLDEAEAMHSATLERRIRVLGSEHASVAESNEALGLLSFRRGDLPRSIHHFREALAVAEKALGGENSMVANIVANLTSALTRAGQYAEAEPYCRRLLQIDEKSLGPTSPHVISDRRLLGEILTRLGRLEEAEGELRETVRTRQSLTPDDLPNLGVDQLRLAQALTARGAFEEAEALLQTANQAVRNRDKRLVAEGFATLYEKWNAAQADPQRARQATEWRDLAAAAEQRQ